MRQVFDYMRDTYRQAQRANVNVYTVSPAGVGGMEQLHAVGSAGRASTCPPYETAANYFDFLVGVAENTGGRAFPDRNEFGTALDVDLPGERLVLPARVPAADPALDGKYRRVEVKVNRPGVTVRTRNGYYNEKPPTRRRRRSVTADDGAVRSAAEDRCSARGRRRAVRDSRQGRSRRGRRADRARGPAGANCAHHRKRGCCR